MPYRTLGVDEVARYLHLDRTDVERLVKNQDIPFERHGARLVFRKIEIDAWASPRILGLDGKHLADYHQKTSSETRSFRAREPILPHLIEPDFIRPALTAKTRASILREMAGLAQETGRVWDPAGLLSGLEAREKLCSTGLPGGLALLHARNPESYLFESLFIVLGRTLQQVPFGAPDGKPTDLFFLIACPDDQRHLHTLARLCLIVQRTSVLCELRNAPDAESMFDCLIRAEQAALCQS